MSDDPPAESAAQPLGHEHRILARLAGIEGIAFFPGDQESETALLNQGGKQLAQALKTGPLEVPHLLSVALRLAKTLAAVHRHGVLHRNISPEHIMLHGPKGSPLLVGFHFATTFVKEQPGFTHHRQIRGNLAYLAPEQTGRTGRSVDLRADLYALGATLYEAATGQPPFHSLDSLQLLHDQLARLPVAPVQLRADMPAALSDIILRLLEKEPERRYQSAEGLAHDLALVQRAFAAGDNAPQRLGEQDFPMQLTAPSRLVGRSPETSALRHALDKAVRDSCRVVLVAGAPGVGKTSLINELRPMVTARRGFFAAGKYDQYRQDAPTATVQAIRALGRLLLAESEADLAPQRERILRALGANAGLICNGPEFALLLGPQPELPQVEPAQAEARLLATVVNLLGAIASADRPIVIVLDDLQWASAISVRFIDAVLHAPELPGLLVVGSYRDSEVDAVHPLAAAISGWNHLARAPLQLRLANLPGEDLQEMLQQMLRLPRQQAAALARAVGEHTAGNPFDTVELLNTMRADGALRPGAGGWEWDAATLRRYVGQSGVIDLLAARITRLPLLDQTLLHAMACLGGEVPRSLLCAACGLSVAEVDQQVAGPLEEGLLVIEPGEDATLRMRHDRVQQAVYAMLDPTHRRALHLALARRLHSTPEFGRAAVQQYLPAIDGIEAPQECRKVARLLHEMAVANRRSASHLVAQRLLAAALSLLSRLPIRTPDDETLLTSLEIEHHLALCSLGRLDEADDLYRVIEERGAPVEQWVDAAGAQVCSLNSRSRPREAVELGLSLLRQLGLDVPDFVAADLEQRLACFGQWIKHVDLSRDSQPYTGGRRSTATARLIGRLAYPAYLCDVRVMAWLILEAQVLWIRHGPSCDLALALAHQGAVTIGLIQDYQTAYDGSRQALGACQTRGWESGASESRFLFALHASHWFDPLEHTVDHLHRAREGMLRNGDQQNACFSYRPLTTAMLDCTPTLQEWAAQVESGLALASRIGNDYVNAMLSSEQQVLRKLRGQAEASNGSAQDVQASLQVQSRQSNVNLSIHFCHALSAAIFQDTSALVRHAAAAMEHVPFFLTSYRGTQARLLHALALAQRARTAAPGERGTVLAELDAGCEWLARRAADAPDNFLHLVKWIEAERAWAVGNTRAATAAAFDAALFPLESLSRPWHHALINERAGLFHLEQGMSNTGRKFIARARDLYQAWGATAKVRHLEGLHSFLTSASLSDRASPYGATVQVDTIDALAILRASQALSSETSLPRLKTRVVDVMGALTGATGVKFALWDEDLNDWYLSDGPDPEVKLTAAFDAEGRTLVPLSAFRYAERTREALLVENAVADDRFLRDPFFEGLAHCSLLIVPILNQGSLRAMLLLENRLSRGAFTTGRLDAVSLIAGQLAVSLENALLYDRLEQRVRVQTGELVTNARRAGMAQIATNVLHNVGNVLTSVNVSTHLLAAKVRQSRSARLTDVADLLDAHSTNLRRFFEDDDRGRMLPGYVRDLAQALQEERDELLGELNRLAASVDHIKNVVAMQQSYAGASGMREWCSMTQLVQDALRIQEDALMRHRIAVAKDCPQVSPAPLDKTRLMQILVNLIENARQAMEGVSGERTLTIAVRQDVAWAEIAITDNGCGIASENLPRIFSHGFTTKPKGHGFGLHSSAMAATEMGGTLSVHSDGPGSGTRFTLRVPLEPGARPLDAPPDVAAGL
jgi:predicted ATPase/signal transduction histidine kinase